MRRDYVTYDIADAHHELVLAELLGDDGDRLRHIAQRCWRLGGTADERNLVSARLLWQCEQIAIRERGSRRDAQQQLMRWAVKGVAVAAARPISENSASVTVLFRL